MAALRIGDEPLTPVAVAAAARGGPLEVELSGGARERIAKARAGADAAAARRPVYGRTTGVGANRDVAVDDGGREHALRLLRSHAGGLGEPLSEEVVRATVLIRLNQMAAGGGGTRPEVADAFVALLKREQVPAPRDLGGIGTGDLTVLSQLGLALEVDGDHGSFQFVEGDALPLMSSNAATLAVAALAWADLRELLDAGLGVAAAVFQALDGNAEAFAESVGASRPLPGLVEVMGRLRALTADAGPPARLQDPFALRCLPAVAGALHGALAGLHDVLAVEMGAAVENPLVGEGEVWHHGGFHAASTALALDTLRLALVPFGQLSAARLAYLMEPRMTGLTPFLAAGAPGSSGLLIAEYLAADALARLRTEAAPAIMGSAVISRGVEDHASFAWQGALQARRAVEQLRTVIALEWVAAERALTMRRVPAPSALRELLEPDGRSLADQPIADDVERALAVLPALAAAVRSAQ